VTCEEAGQPVGCSAFQPATVQLQCVGFPGWPDMIKFILTRVTVLIPTFIAVTLLAAL
jgi:hypothetical protein